MTINCLLTGNRNQPILVNDHDKIEEPKRPIFITVDGQRPELKEEPEVGMIPLIIFGMR